MAGIQHRLEWKAVAALLLAVLMLGSSLSAARAVQPDEVLQDASLEARARRLSAELRCLVCQNQSIDDSNAPLARDLRLIVRERLLAGDSDDAVLDFVVSRYGKFVLLRPPMELDTIALWLAPFVLLASISIVVLLYVRRRRDEAAAALTPEEQARLETLLKDRE